MCQFKIEMSIFHGIPHLRGKWGNGFFFISNGPPFPPFKLIIIIFKFQILLFNGQYNKYV